MRKQRLVTRTRRLSSPKTLCAGSGPARFSKRFESETRLRREMLSSRIQHSFIFAQISFIFLVTKTGA